MADVTWFSCSQLLHFSMSSLALYACREWVCVHTVTHTILHLSHPTLKHSLWRGRAHLLGPLSLCLLTKHDRRKLQSFLLGFIYPMASLRRFGSCSSCQLRNNRQNENGRRWKCRSAVPEWLVGSRIKAQGEKDVWKTENKAPTPPPGPQAGAPVHLCNRPHWIDRYLHLIRLDSTCATCIFEL